MRSRILIIVVIIIVVIFLFAWHQKKGGTPGPGEENIPKNTVENTLGDITVKHPKDWKAGMEGASNLLAFTVANKAASLAVETGLQTGTLDGAKERLGNAWREVSVAGENGIEIGLGSSEEGSGPYLRFEYYSDTLAGRGERLVVTVTGFTAEEVAHLEGSAFDPYAILTQQNLASLRSVVAEARVN